MKYEEACSVFDVKETKRQKTKWKNKSGRAYVLAQGLPSKFAIARSITLGTVKDDEGEIVSKPTDSDLFKAYIDGRSINRNR